VVNGLLWVLTSHGSAGAWAGLAAQRRLRGLPRPGSPLSRLAPGMEQAATAIWGGESAIQGHQAAGGVGAAA
jgi:hypothetical protein